MALWIYLSPHFDDAVLSCGGMIWTQVQSGQQVEIWTVCAGEIPPGPLSPFAQSLHERWQAGDGAVPARRAEDLAACAAVGAKPRHFTLPDCIYRRLPDGEPVVKVNDDLWLPYPAGEKPLVERLSSQLTALLPAHCHLVCPLTVGGHMDHRLVRAAAERLGRRQWYYADYPYAVSKGFNPLRWLGPGFRSYAKKLVPAAVNAWQNGVATYTSQISSFWPGLDELRQAIAAYACLRPGHSLWRPKEL